MGSFLIRFHLVLFFCLLPCVVKANEDLASFWVQHIPTAAGVVPEMSGADLKVFATKDQALFQFQTSEQLTQVACHVHRDSGVCHCDLVWVESEIPRDHSLIFDLSSQKMQDLLVQLDVHHVASGDPLWPWILGAVAGYYVSKKLINLWLHRHFEARPHTHDFSILSHKERQQQVFELQRSMSHQLESLDEVFTENLKINIFERARLQNLLEMRVAELARQVIVDLSSTYCHTCQMDHHPQRPHLSNQFKTSGSIDLMTTVGAQGLGFKYFDEQKRLESQKSLSLKVSSFDETNEHQSSVAKQAIQRGIIVRTTKALLEDLYREFVEPFPRIAKSLRRALSTSGSFKQIRSYTRAKYYTSVGESNITTASAVVVSLLTIKLLGETAETVVFGPFHVLCQISDVAAVTAGLAFLTVYHTLRQPLRHKRFGLLIQKRFWKMMSHRLTQPSFEKRAEALKTSEGGRPQEILWIEIERLKKNLLKMLWQFHALDLLSSSHLKNYSLRLGEISKNKEDVLFDFKINDLDDPQDLIKTIEVLKPAYLSYQALFKDLNQELSRQPQKPLQCRHIF